MSGWLLIAFRWLTGELGGYRNMPSAKRLRLKLHVPNPIQRLFLEKRVSHLLRERSSTCVQREPLLLILTFSIFCTAVKQLVLSSPCLSPRRPSVLTVSLLSGLTSIIPLSKAWQSGGIKWGMWNTPLFTFSRSCRRLSWSKGKAPWEGMEEDGDRQQEDKIGWEIEMREIQRDENSWRVVSLIFISSTV